MTEVRYKRIRVPENFVRKLRLLKWRLPKSFKTKTVEELLQYIEIDIDKTLKKLRKELSI